jgi:rRNA-processing protein FCF1
MLEVIHRIKTVLENDETLGQELMSTASDSSIIYTCDTIILPIYFNEIDIDSIMEAVHKTKPNIKVVAIIIDKLTRLKGVPSTDIMFSASIQLIDAKLKEIAINNDVSIIYNKQIPKESIMFV